MNLWCQPEYFDVDAFVDAWGNCPAQFLQTGFLLLKPVANLIEKPLALWERLDDDRFVDEYLTMETWLADNIPVAGETFREFVKGLYQQNLLVQNRMRIGRRLVDLKQITCPVLNLMASRDDLVPCAQSEPFNDLVGSSDRRTIKLDVGHIGLAMGTKAQAAALARGNPLAGPAELSGRGRRGPESLVPSPATPWRRSRRHCCKPRRCGLCSPSGGRAWPCHTGRPSPAYHLQTMEQPPMKISRRTLLAGTTTLAAWPYLVDKALADPEAKSPAPAERVVLTAMIKAKPGEEDAVKEVLLALVEPTRKEPGCLCYNLHQSKSDKDKAQFMFYEQWASNEALETHRQTPYMKALRGKLAGKTEPGRWPSTPC